MLGHAHDAAVHVDVLTGGKLGMETSTDLQQTGDAPFIADGACAGGGDVAEQFQQGALSGSILADDAYYITLLHGEVDVAQRPDIFTITLGGAVIDITNLQVWVFLAQYTCLPPTIQVVAEGASAYTTEAVLFADVLKNYSLAHNFSTLTITLTLTEIKYQP